MKESLGFIAFKEEKLDKTIYIAILMAISMFMSFTLLDRLLNLEKLEQLLYVRIIMSSVAVIFALLTFLLRNNKSFIRVVPFIMILSGTIYSAFLSHYAGGFTSNYWAGFSFFIVAWCGIFPQNYITSILTSFFFIILYNGLLILLNLNTALENYIFLIESNVFLFGSLLVGVIVSYVSYLNKVNIYNARQEILIEKRKSDNLLLNILPSQIADRLKNGETTISDYFDNVAILFADIVGFTTYCSGKPSIKIVEILNEIFYAFDKKTEELGLEKIKTIGDGYMVMAGGLKTSTGELLKTIDLGDFMINFIEEFNTKYNLQFSIRVGIHIGSVTAGVIGKTKFSFDIWGDTVNIASRMESSGVPMQIHITEEVAHYLKDMTRCEYRGGVEIKGKGIMKTYIIHRYIKI